MYIVIVLLYRDLPLSTTSFSVEMIGASKRLYIKDSSIGMHIIYMYTCTLYIVHAYVYIYIACVLCVSETFDVTPQQREFAYTCIYISFRCPEVLMYVHVHTC